MITNMDYNIGRVLGVLDELGIAEQTIVLFTSDNGPENEAGSPGAFKGGKRLLAEGGIRVPCIVQWKGHIAAGQASDKFMLTTDLLPTLLQAAGWHTPPHVRLDGVSALPMLLAAGKEGEGASLLWGDERVVMWYSHAVGFPKLAAAQSHGFKLVRVLLYC